MTEPTDQPGKRPYTMSELALAQRRANQPAATEASRPLSTGPRTEEGKAAVSRNGWKHGRASAINRAHFGVGATSLAKLFGKPCRTTCPFHPENPERTEAPCALVLDGLTRAGGSCLDKTVYVHALDALMAAMSEGEMDGMHGVLANEVASNLAIVDQVRQAIADHGVMVPTYERDKHGKVVLDPRTVKVDELGNETGEPMVFDLKVNPAIFALAKLTDTLGINVAELIATPRAVRQAKDEGEKADAMQTLIGGILARAGARPPQRPAIEHDDDA